MCGIAGAFGVDVKPGVEALRHRGPDGAGIMHVGDLELGHTRLAILDPDPRSDQPFRYGDVTLVYNGEIWNYESLREELRKRGRSFSTTGDTEVLASAIAEWGADAFQRIEGMFAVAWTRDGEFLHVARDRFGEVPIYFSTQRPFGFASERKALLALGFYAKSIRPLPPDRVLNVAKTGARSLVWIDYYNLEARDGSEDRASAAPRVRKLLDAGVEERTISDVPVCTLLSGGIDSAAITHFLASRVPDLTAYTARFDPRSKDLQAARRFAKAAGVRLVEVDVPAPTAEGLSELVRSIETPAKAQVEIAWACDALARRMAEDGFKVTFSGEGSDELWASYGFAYYGLQQKPWGIYRRDLILDQARKNFLRCNKVFMRYGVECRLPFLHRPLVEYALSLPRETVQNGRDLKAVFQEAMKGLLPEFVVDRPKVAFQDGLGLKRAIQELLPNSRRFYRVEYRKHYHG